MPLPNATDHLVAIHAKWLQKRVVLDDTSIGCPKCGNPAKGLMVTLERVPVTICCFSCGWHVSGLVALVDPLTTDKETSEMTAELRRAIVRCMQVTIGADLM